MTPEVEMAVEEKGKDGGREAVPRWDKVVRAMGDGEWHTTVEIAERLEIQHRRGSHDLRPLREMLYSLQLHGWVEQEPRHNGHRWRLMEAALPDGVTRAEAPDA